MQMLQTIADIGTMLTGLIALFRPQSVEGCTVLRAEDGRSTTEFGTCCPKDGFCR